MLEWEGADNIISCGFFVPRVSGRGSLLIAYVEMQYISFSPLSFFLLHFIQLSSVIFRQWVSSLGKNIVTSYYAKSFLSIQVLNLYSIWARRSLFSVSSFPLLLLLKHSTEAAFMVEIFVC